MKCCGTCMHGFRTGPNRGICKFRDSFGVWGLVHLGYDSTEPWIKMTDGAECRGFEGIDENDLVAQDS